MVLLSENGTANASIILPDHPDELEQKAAEVLQTYFKKIGDATIPIGEGNAGQVAIYLGRHPAQEWEGHTVGYRVVDQQFYMGGGTPKATLDAVYVFLENEFGCRFYSPSVEKIPQQSSIAIPATLNYEYTPPITTRTVHSRLFYEHPAFAEKLRVTDEAFPTYVPGARVHTFHRFLPADKFYPAHPEYYALRNGKRLTTQLCLTNEAVYEIVRDSVAAQLARHPSARVISVSQDDNTQYCQCDNCEAIHQAEDSPSGSMIWFVNRIAEQFPDHQISTLAYQYTRKAPRNIKPRENVLVTLCSIECDRSAPIAEKCPDFAADLKAWSKISDNIRIWDYTTQFTNFLAPFPNLYTLQPNIELFLASNAKWIFEQHSNQPSELFELRSYLTAKLLWQPDADAATILDDFLSGYYEAAGPYLKNYIETIHAELQRDSSFFLFLYGDPSQGFNSFLSDQWLGVYDSLYQEAAMAVADRPELVERVNTARLSVDYALLEYARRQMALAVQSPELATRLARFEATTRQANITAMNEMRFSVAEYIEGYKKTMERAKSPNLAYGKKVVLNTQPKKYADEDPLTLTDGALGGSNFYANWLGFEGNNLEAVIDLGKSTPIRQISSAFLQVTNHLVFFPEVVEYWYSQDGENYRPFARIPNRYPLTKSSKINDIQYFISKPMSVEARYIKIIGRSSLVAPEWHHGSGLPAWIFLDEVMVR